MQPRLPPGYCLALRKRSLCLVNDSQYLEPPSLPLNSQVECLAHRILRRSDTPSRDSMTDKVLLFGGQRYIHAIAPSQWGRSPTLSASPMGKRQQALVGSDGFEPPTLSV
jgi:hypothetical protein